LTSDSAEKPPCKFCIHGRRDCNGEGKFIVAPGKFETSGTVLSRRAHLPHFDLEGQPFERESESGSYFDITGQPAGSGLSIDSAEKPGCKFRFIGG